MADLLDCELLSSQSDLPNALMAGAALGKPKLNPAAHGAPYAVVPEGYTLQTLPTWDAPQHPKALTKLRDAKSFIRYVSDHKMPRSRIYAQLEPARFLAVFDDFDAASANAQDAADWREWRADFTVPASREWLLWTKANRQHMSQLSFAEFLQDNLPDVTEPAGADLLTMALNFEAAQSGAFVAQQRLQDGSHNLQWKAESNASGSVQLPEFLTLRIPVFENADPQEMRARLRYRIKEGTLSIWFELVRPHKVLEDAFRAAWATIEEVTGVPILLGQPE